jgi:hypothetical protein
MTFGEILSTEYELLRLPAAPPAATIARIKSNINKTHRKLLRTPGISRLRDDVMPITAFAGVARSGLPPVVSRIRGITDRTNNVPLGQVSLADLRLMNASGSFTSGYPTRFAVVGYRPVQLQPTAATGLWAVSSAAGDTTQAVFVQTITTGGYQYSDTKTLNGVTRVQIGATVRTDHEQVTRFYLSAACVGYISLYTASSGGTELARLEPGLTTQHYLTVEWFPVQTGDATEYVDYTRNIPELVQAFDEPLIPLDFHELLGLGARIKEYELLDDDRIVSAKAEYREIEAALKTYVLNDGDQISSLRPRVGGRPSAFGSNYPSTGGGGGSGWAQ